MLEVHAEGAAPSIQRMDLVEIRGVNARFERLLTYSVYALPFVGRCATVRA